MATSSASSPMALMAMILGVMAAATAAHGLSLSGARCGQLTCNLHEHCSQFENRCMPCAPICDDKSHNYDASVCVKDCQDYIHDLRYMRKDGGGVNEYDDKSLKATIKSLEFKFSVVLIICCVLLVMVLLIMCVRCVPFIRGNYKKFSWAWLRKKMHTPKKSPKKQHQPSSNDGIGNKPDCTISVTEQSLNVCTLQPISPSVMSGVPSSAAVVPQAIISTSARQPAEDSSLVYSYDNMALNVTPSPNRQHQM